MRKKAEQIDEKEQIERLAAVLQPELGQETNLVKALRCFSVRGAATRKQVETLSGLTEKETRAALDRLLKPGSNASPALRTAQVLLENQMGRPRSLYLLTDDGLAAWERLGYRSSAGAPQLKDQVELSHALAEMEIHTLAIRYRLAAEIEKVLPFGESSTYIRVDVLVDTGGKKKLIYEVEQTAPRSALPRIVDKLTRLQQFFSSPQGKDIDRQIRILFNIANRDMETLAIWQEALEMVSTEQNGNLSFELYFQHLLPFLEQPIWKNLNGFTRMEAAELAVKDNVGVGETQEPDPDPLTLGDMSIIMRAMRKVYQSRIKALKNAEDHRERCIQFFNLIMDIYEIDHYYNSPVMLYAAKADYSLFMLHTYLHSPQNEALLKSLKTSLAQAQGNRNRVTMYRDAMTSMLWSFLGYHGFARGGPLRVVFQAPDFDGMNSDYSVYVVVGHSMYPDDSYHKHPIGGKSRLALALTWVLEALYFHSKELGIN